MPPPPPGTTRQGAVDSPAVPLQQGVNMYVYAREREKEREMDRSIHDNRMSIDRSIDRSIGEVQPTSDGGPGWVPKSCHFIAAVLLLTGVGWPQLANATPIVVGEQQRYGSFVTTPHHTIIIQSSSSKIHCAAVTKIGAVVRRAAVFVVAAKTRRRSTARSAWTLSQQK